VPTLVCSVCGEAKLEAEYSKSQLRRNRQRACPACVASGVVAAAAAAAGADAAQKEAKAGATAAAAAPAAGKGKYWWRKLPDVDPISLERLSRRPYPPFAFEPEPPAASGSVTEGGGGGGSKAGAVRHWFDAKVLANYLISTGRFVRASPAPDSNALLSQRRSEHTKSTCRREGSSTRSPAPPSPSRTASRWTSTSGGTGSAGRRWRWRSRTGAP